MSYVAPEIDWAALVAGIQSGDDRATAELYRITSRGISSYIARHCGSQDLNDRVHEVYIALLTEIRRGDLRDPTRLVGFLRAIARRAILAWVNQRVITRKRDASDDFIQPVADGGATPESIALAQERRTIARRALDLLDDRDREVLERYYVEEQPIAQICQEMGLTMTQFRLLKSRAKARFGEVGARLAHRRGIPRAA